MTIEKLIQKNAIEQGRADVGSTRSPPGRHQSSVMEANPAKQAGIAKYEGPARLLQHQVVVLFRSKAGRFRSQFAGHAEMNSDPIAAGKFEEHLLAPRLRTQETPAGQLAHDLARIASAKNSFPRVELDGDDFAPDPWIPLPAKKFHFGQLRHRRKIAAAQTGSLCSVARCATF